MSETLTRGQQILVDVGDPSRARPPESQKGAELVSWVVGKIGPWRDHRNQNYVPRWEEYWRMWRGIWAADDKNRQSERSRLIAPALAQAIEMSVAEVEEAVLSREVWFDIADDISDEEREDATAMRDLLLEDMEEVNAKDSVSEVVLNAAIFGTGIAKINVDVGVYSVPQREERTNRLIKKDVERVYVCVESYRPDQVIPDPAGRTVTEMMGIAFEHETALHAILEKIEAGVYREEAASQIGGGRVLRGESMSSMKESIQTATTDVVTVIEYHGKVPLKLLNKLQEAKTALDEILAEDDDDSVETEMVEAIITYANDNVLLRAIPNPFTMKDRSVVALQWEKVPGRFWGRGVAEKGYNPQKALDAELRARADALGFVSAPMLGIDAGRIPRGFKPEVKPGKVWLTNGPPDEVLRPVMVGQLDPNTFNQTAELTQMVQMGTGAFDTGTQLRSTGSGGNPATSGSMMLGAFVKRSKRAIQNIDRNLLQPLIRKVALRYMQFDPERYPFDDTKFYVKAVMGIIAREIEQVNLTQLIGMLPEQGVQTKLAAAQGFIELSSVLNKAEIVQALKADKESAGEQMKAQAEAEQKQAELEMRLQEIALESETTANQKMLAEIRKLLAQAQSEERQVDIKEIMAILEGQRIKLQAEEIRQFGVQNQISAKRLELQDKQLEWKMSQDSSGKA